MSNDRPDLRLADPEERRPSGCMGVVGGLGLMAYGGLIVGMGTVGLVGIVWVIYTTFLLAQEQGAELMSGFEVDGWRLKELRTWGVLPENVTPALYHDHSNAMDGSAGCMVVEGDVVVWFDQELTVSVPLEGATVTGVDEGLVTVTIVNGETATCYFRPGEGGDRFLRMLQAEAS